MLNGVIGSPCPTHHRGHIRKPFFSLKNDFEIKTDLEKEIFVEDMQKIVDTNEMLVKEMKDAQD